MKNDKKRRDGTEAHRVGIRRSEVEGNGDGQRVDVGRSEIHGVVIGRGFEVEHERAAVAVVNINGRRFVVTFDGGDGETVLIERGDNQRIDERSGVVFVINGGGRDHGVGHFVSRC